MPHTTSTPARAAKRLNAHHERTCAGFYTAEHGRCFAARVRKGALEVSPDFGRNWYPLPLDARVTDHNGRPVYL